MKKNNKKGFTLVELVIVVAVMAVLVAVAIPTIGSVLGTAKDAVAESNARTIESVIKLAEANVATGETSLSPDDIAKAIYEAKLGIVPKADVESGESDGATYSYNIKTGAVSAGTVEGADIRVITFSSEGVVEVTKATNDASGTANGKHPD